MLSADYIKFDLNKVIALLRVGYLKVAENFQSDEAIIMRVSAQLLETLLTNVEKQEIEKPPYKTSANVKAVK